LLSKESTLPLPAVIGLLYWWKAPDRPQHGPEPRSTRSVGPLPIVLFLISTCYAAYLTRPREVGIRIGFDTEAAYAFDFGAAFFRNLLTYVGWTADIAMLHPGLRFVDQQNPALFPFAVGVLLAAALLSLWRTLRRRGWLIGLVSFLFLLVPVLPLRNHAYHYYLYAPLMAAALCFASFVDALFGRAGAPHIRTQEKVKIKRRNGALKQVRLMPWAVASLGCAVLTWNGARLVTQMEKRSSPVYPGLRGDPIVDRALIAERAITGLRQAEIPAGTEMVFIMRERVALLARIMRGSGEQPPPAQEVYPETNVKTALFDGLGVRALLPGVASVTFVRDSLPVSEKTRYVIYAPQGEVTVLSWAQLDSLLRSRWITQW